MMEVPPFKMDFSIKAESYAILDDYRNSFQKIEKIHTKKICGREIQDPFLSVIVPTYRRCGCLKESLQSICSQVEVDFSWEIIVVENPSNDSGTCEKLIRDLNDKRIQFYCNEENIGSGYNWNRGVELARGKWITFVHDDDVLCPDALQNIKKIIDRLTKLRKPLGYIQGRNIEFSTRFDAAIAHAEDRNGCILLTRKTALITGSTHTGTPSYGTTILRKAYLETGGVNYDFGATADAVLGYQIMNNYTVVIADKVLGGHRWAENESLRPQTVISLLQSDWLFAKYRYEQSFAARLWGRCFGDLIAQRNQEKKIQRVKNEEDRRLILQKLPVQKKCPKWKCWLYDILVLQYRLLRRLKSWLLLH